MQEVRTGRIPQELYLQILQVMPRPCVDLVVKNQGKILLLKRKIHPQKGFWAIPGGMINKGETIKAAAIRKADEELGLKVSAEDLKFSGVVNFIHYERQDIVLTYALNLMERPEIALDYQHSEAKWFSFDEILELGEMIDMQVVGQIELALGINTNWGDV
jgi:8-oxo-dGTP diphosphatase